MEVNTTWLETYYVIATSMQTHLDLVWNQSEIKTAVKVCQHNYGSIELAHLAKEWTDEFEKLYEGEDWEEGDWFETLEEFFNKKNNEQ